MSLKILFKRLLGFLPRKIPVGVSEFEAWAASLAETYDLPTKDADSIKFTLASIIMHLGAQSAYKSDFFFYVTMTAAAGKQVAGSIFYQIKKEQAQKQADEAAAAAAKEVPSDGSSQ